MSEKKTKEIEVVIDVDDSNLSKKINSILSKFNKVKTLAEECSNRIVSLFSTTQQMSQQVIVSVSLDDALREIETGFNRAIDSIEGGFVSAFNEASNAIGNVTDRMSQVQGVADTLAEWNVPFAAELSGHIGSGIERLQGLQGALGGVKEGFFAKKGAARETFGNIMDSVNSARERIGGITNAMGGFGKKIFATGKKFLVAFGKFILIGLIIALVVKLIKNTEIFQKIIDKVIEVFQKLWSIVQPILERIMGVFISIGETIMNIVGFLIGGLKSAFQAVWRAIQPIVAPILRIMNFVGGLFGRRNNNSSPAEEAPMLATGGQVSYGQVFVARENGIPEYVGSMGGRATVANNTQIVEGIKEGVAQGVKEAMAYYGGNNQSVVVKIDGEEVRRIIARRERNVGANSIRGVDLNGKY